MAADCDFFPPLFVFLAGNQKPFCDETLYVHFAVTKGIQTFSLLGVVFAELFTPPSNLAQDKQSLPATQ